jgi:hypothetical protein
MAGGVRGFGCEGRLAGRGRHRAGGPQGKPAQDLPTIGCRHCATPCFGLYRSPRVPGLCGIAVTCNANPA